MGKRDSREEIELLIGLFKSYISIKEMNYRVPQLEREDNAKKKIKEFRDQISSLAGNPQMFSAIEHSFMRVLDDFNRDFRYIMDKGYVRAQVQRTLAKEHKEYYSLPEATVMMNYKDRETIVKKIESGIIEARNIKKDGAKNNKYEIHISEIRKHRRPKKD